MGACDSTTLTPLMLRVCACARVWRGRRTGACDSTTLMPLMVRVCVRTCGVAAERAPVTARLSCL
jgi:hypothetical protein